MLKLFKKKEEVPDVGKEEQEEVSEEEALIRKKLSDLPEHEDHYNYSSPSIAVNESQVDNPAGFYSSSGTNVGSERTNLEFEKLKGKLESLDAMMRNYSERFSALSQQIGEIRAMNMNNEKQLSRIGAESSKAIDIVKEVKPEKIRIDYEKLDMKIEANEASLASMKQYTDEIMGELKEVRRKAESFSGTDSLLKLSEDVKKDLRTIQQVNERTKANADKSEQLFIEFNKSFDKFQKLGDSMDMLENNFASLQKDFGKFKIDLNNIVSKDELAEVTNNVNNKLALMQKVSNYVESSEKEDERLAHLLDSTISIVQHNKREIDDLALAVGDDKLKKVADYDNRLNSILDVLDKLAGQIADIKKKLGMRVSKIKVKPEEHKEIVKSEVKTEVSGQKKEDLSYLEGFEGSKPEHEVNNVHRHVHRTHMRRVKKHKASKHKKH